MSRTRIVVAAFALVPLWLAWSAWDGAPASAEPASAAGIAAVGLHARPAAALPPIFVLNSGDASVSVIDPASYTELRRIDTGKQPHHLYLTPDEHSLVVANAASDSLTFVDPRSGEVQRTVTGIADPYHLRFSPDMKWFVVAANRLDHVDIYRWHPQAEAPLELVKRIEAASTPSHLWIDSRSTVVYVTLQDSNELMAIDLATQEPRWRIPVGRTPADVYVTPDDRHAFVAATGESFVDVFDLAGEVPTLLTRIETGAGAHAFRSRGDGRMLFVSNRAANTVSLIDTAELKVVDTLPAPGGPDCLELSADGRLLMMSSRWSRQLTVVDVPSRQVIAQVPVGRSPHGVWTLDHAPRQ
jgi:YVTN family beta-propeller protein